MDFSNRVQAGARLVARLSMQTISKINHKIDWPHIRKYWVQEWLSVSHARLYFAAATASFTLLGVSYSAIDHISQTQSWYQVFANGKFVGLVPNQSNVTDVMRRIAYGYHVNLNLEPIHANMNDGYDWKTTMTLPTSAVAITLNGKPLVYTSTASEAHQVLQTVQNKLLPPGLPTSATVHFVGNVQVLNTTVSVTDILNTKAAVDMILHPTAFMLSGRGEGLSSIVGTVKAATKSTPQGAFVPLLQVSADETLHQRASAPFPVKYIDDNQMGTGSYSVVKKGKPGVVNEVVQLHFVDGKLASKTVVSKDVIQPAQEEIMKRGTNSGVASGAWGWPTTAYDITSPFGWRILFGGENFHPGVDIGCAIGTPIYATNNGVVEEAGWNSGGYGNWVKINNGNGIETVFGHMSNVVAHAGEVVAKGELIGYSGETGFATGPHLHYEVRKWGSPIDPGPYM